MVEKLWENKIEKRRGRGKIVVDVERDVSFHSCGTRKSNLSLGFLRDLFVGPVRESDHGGCTQSTQTTTTTPCRAATIPPLQPFPQKGGCIRYDLFRRVG